MKIVAHGNDSGSKNWRLLNPFKYLRKKGIQAYVSDRGINEEEAMWADINIIQSCTDKDGIALLYRLQQEYGKKLVVECDDWVDLNEDSPFKKEHEKYDARRTITRTMEVADMVTTTTKYLADKLKQYNDNVVVLPNYIDLNEWKLPLPKEDDKQIRIGWTGSITHVEDMKMVVEPLRRICKEFKNVQLVMLGDPRVTELFKGMPVEGQNGVPAEVWPTKLRSLRLDIGLAPLQDNVFNRCKSNIKWIEYSIMGIPGVYAPIVYTDETNHSVHFDGTYGMVAENAEQWYRCIKNYIICENLRRDIASRARGCIISGYTLKTNIKKWVKAYKSLTK